MVASMYHMVAMKILIIANPADSAKFADLSFFEFLSCVCFAVIRASQQTRCTVVPEEEFRVVTPPLSIRLTMV